MDDTKKMLRAIINGQSAMKSELLEEIHKVDKKVDKVDQKVDQRFDSLSEKIKSVETNLTGRIDKLGLQIARLEDDSPTREELDDLDKRVSKLEQVSARN